MVAIKSLTLSVICVFSLVFNAQSQNEVPTMEWDRFTTDELHMTTWQDDTTASAVVLGHFGELYMGEVENNLGYELIVHKRIKILKKSALEQGNIEIPYYAKNNFEFVSFKRAQTITKSGKKIPIDSKSVFKEKLNENWNIVKFAFPNVEEGAILEYEYTISSKNLLQLHEWYFQERMPTKASLLKLNIESRFEYQFLFQGENNLRSTKPEYKNISPNPSGQRTIISFYVNNLPGLVAETFISSMNNYYTRIRFQLATAYNAGGGKDRVLPDWEGTVTKLLDNDEIGKRYLKKSQYSKVLEKVKTLINPTDSVDVKVKTLYDWVNKNFTWNERLGIFGMYSGNELLEKGKGNSASINLLLIALLREAGVEANPVLLSTRSHEKPYKEFPIIDQFNQLIVHVEKSNNQSLFLDAGNILRPMGILNPEDLNENGWLLKKKGSQWLNIKAPLSEKSFTADMVLTEKGDCQGSASYQYKNYYALSERSKWLKGDSSKINETVLKKKADWIVTESKSENLIDVEMPFKNQFKLSVANAAQANGSFLYFKPVLESDWEINPFKLPNRNYPIEFPFPMGESYTLNLTIPKGYKVEELPKAANESIQSGELTFNYATTQVDDKITVRLKVFVRKPTIDSKYYESIKNFFGQIASKLEEPIVLKKINE